MASKKSSVKPRRTPKKPARLSRTHRPEDMSIEQWQAGLRRQFGREQKFKWKNTGGHPVFSEFAVTNPQTKMTYRVAIRGNEIGRNFCTCRDFSVNTLGTCKHVEFSLARLERKKRNRDLLAAGFHPPYSEIFLRYGAERRVVFAPGREAPPGLKKLSVEYFGRDGVLLEQGYSGFGGFLDRARKSGHEVCCYDDALAFIAEKQDAERRTEIIGKSYNAKKAQKENGKLLFPGLKVPLYPYQYEGVVFAARAGRCLIADDMGLGKTIQAIAAAEILAREFGAEKVLIVCPASLKYQWKQEIEKFCHRPALVIEGPLHRRRELYAADSFYKIVNYDVVHRDLEAIGKLAPDLVVLDEAQRIKNWKTRAARSIKRIESPYAFVLTGTPLENRLEELHSIVEFVDRFRLGPLFHFLHKHQITDPETGKVTGYQRLKSVGQTLGSILVRRTRAEVLPQLPERMDKNFFVPMTREQMEHHTDNQEIVARLAAKWKKQKFLCEADQRRLTIALQNMRMACDSTYLLDKKTKLGPKADELAVLLREMFEQPETKAVVFSQWTRMHEIVAEKLKDCNIRYAFLHGGLEAGGGRRRCAPLRRTRRCAYSFPRTPAGLALTCRTPPPSLTWTCPGTRRCWSSASAACTGWASAGRCGW
jgi:hypothetical protein